MGVLDQLLEYKKYKDAQNNADLQAIPQAAMLYQQGKQQQLENTIKTLTLQGTLAKSGIGIGPNNQLVADDRFVDQNKSLKAADLLSKIQQRERGAQFLEKALSGDGGNLPPGATFSSGGLTFPLNQKLTDTEQSSVAGVEKFEPLVKQVQGLIGKGVLGKPGGIVENVKRTGKQLLAEHGDNAISRILTPDNSKLEELSSAVAEIKKFAFSEGGKQLSPTEKAVVNAGLTLSGKSDEAIKRDFGAAIDILRKKKLLALGGANSVKNLSSETVDVRAEYNKLRQSGLTAEEARKKLGV